MFEVNYFGAVAMTQRFLSLLRASRGRVINISSILGVLSRGADSAYSSSKFALEGFSDALRKELAPLGVAVVLVNPGVVRTKIQDKIVGSVKGLDHADEWTSLYGRYIEGVEQRFARAVARGDSTDVTSQAIVDAAFAPKPQVEILVLLRFIITVVLRSGSVFCCNPHARITIYIHRIFNTSFASILN